MKKLTLITLLAIASLATYAQTLKADIDSTLALLKTQDVDERMATYYSFADRNRFTDYDSVMPILKQYEEDADRNHRQHDADIARKMQYNLTFNSGYTEKASAIIDEFIEKCDKKKSTEIYNYFITEKINLLIDNKMIQTAYIKTKELLENTFDDNKPLLSMLYCIMGRIYQLIVDDGTSVTYLKKSIDICKQLNDYNQTCEVYFYLSDILYCCHHYDEILTYNDEWWHTIEIAEEEDSHFNATFQRAICLYWKALVHYKKNETQKLHSAYLQMKTLTNNGKDLSIQLMEVFTYDQILSKKYEEAMASIDSQIQYYKEAYTIGDMEWVKLKAKMQYLLGNPEAYLTMIEYDSLSSCITRQTSSSQLNEFATIYEVEQVKSHAKQLRMKMEIAIISASLLLFLAIVIVIYNRRLKQHIKLLCERIDSINTQQTKTVLDSNKQEMVEQYHKGQDSETGSEESNFVSLFDRIEEILRNNDVLASDIDRDELARMVGTNRTYLTNCIRKTTGLSLNDFINTKRVNKAIEMLKENAEMKITDIQAAVGFTSYTTFYRIFNKQFGVTPVDYRNYLLEKMTA